MDGMKAMRKKHLLAVNKARNTKEREGAAAADGVDARPAEGGAVALAGPAAGAEDPAASQPAEKKKRGGSSHPHHFQRYMAHMHLQW